MLRVMPVVILTPIHSLVKSEVLDSPLLSREHLLRPLEGVYVDAADPDLPVQVGSS